MASDRSAFTPDGLKAAGFTGFVTFATLHDGGLDAVPAAPGAYVVVRISPETPHYTATSRGGRFKGRDPVVAEAVLHGKWVEGCSVIYIGKGDVLQRRLGEYARFGRGEPVAHWGGRFIWQLADADQLLVAWREARPGQTAQDAEGELVDEFELRFGRLPFANIADPSTRRRKALRRY